MRSIIYCIPFLLCFLNGCSSENSNEFNKPFRMTLWSYLETENDSTETLLPALEDRIVRITNINEPSINIFPGRGAGIKPAVLIFPGGGYSILAYDLEGTEIAEWLNDIGITAIVVKYTVPNKRDKAFLDAGKALILAREHALEWNIDPEKIGVMGFSAGAHLSAKLSQNRISIIDTLESDHSPDFTVLIYPAYLETLLPVSPIFYSHTNIKDAPTFIMQTKDDTTFLKGTKLYYKALKNNNVDVTFHLFERGGHGYGMRAHPDKNLSEWPKLLKEWFIEQGII